MILKFRISHFRVLLVFLVLLQLEASSQDARYIHLTEKDGLPSNVIFSVMEDSKGFIWLGTDKGLVKWDGTSFKVFTQNEGLASDAIWLTHEDKYNRIWALNNTNPLCYILNDSVYQLYAENDNRAGAASYSYNQEGIIWYPKGEILRIAKDSLENLGSTSSLSKAYLLGTNRFVSLRAALVTELSKAYIAESELIHYNFYLRDSVLVAINKVKPEYYIIGPNTNRLVKVPIEVKEYMSIIPIALDDKIIVDFNQGQYIIDGSDLSFELIYTDSAFDYSSIRSHVDAEGNKYIATISDGLLIDVVKSKVQYREFSLQIIDMCWYEEKLFITTRNDLYVYNHGKFEKIACPSDPKFQYIGMESVDEQLIVYRKDDVFIYENGCLIRLVDRVFNGTIKTNEPEFESLNRIYSPLSLAQFENKKAFLGSYYLLLSEFKDGNNITKYLGYRNLSDHIYFDKDLLLGSSNGLYKYSSFGQLDTLKYGTHESYQNFHLSKEGILYLTRNKNELLSYDGTNFEAIYYTKGEIKDIHLTHMGIILLTKNDLITFPSRQGEEHFTLSLDHLLGENAYNRMESSSDTLWISSKSGMASIALKDIKALKDEPSLYDFSCIVDGSTIEENRHFSTTSNDISFSYKTQSLISLNEIKYRYFLDPVDEKPSFTNNNQIRYPSLSPGEYKFEITAIDPFGNESPTKTFKFNIDPPWYNTWLFYVLAFLLIAGLFYWWSISRIRKAKRRIEKEAIFKEQLANTELSALRAQMNPHFIFNTLAAIQDYMLRAETAVAEDYLTQFAKMIRKFLDYSKINEIALSEELSLLQLYSELENKRFNNEVKIQWLVDDTIDQKKTFIPTLLLQPILENAFNHGLFHKSGNKQLVVKFNTANNLLLCVITENGVGRRNTQSTRSSLKDKSYGLGLVSDRINLLNQLKANRVEMNIIDLLTEEGKAAGTEVQVKILPVKK